MERSSNQRVIRPATPDTTEPFLSHPACKDNRQPSGFGFAHLVIASSNQANATLILISAGHVSLEKAMHPLGYELNNGTDWRMIPAGCGTVIARARP
jgi:hypothetical protein